MRHRADAKILGDRLAKIGKRSTRAEIGTMPHLRARHEQRHVLPRVVRLGVVGRSRDRPSDEHVVVP